VTGKVIDETNLEMIGVTIYVKEDPSSGTITDIDGTYSILLQDSEATLVFSYTGYESKEIPVAAQKVIDVNMENDVANLDEIVVTGYGVQKKSVVTGAIAKVTSKELENLPVRRVEESLQSRTPGVRVTTDSGQPGSGGQVRIRGTGTIFDSDPLYIVDGVPIEGGLDYLSQSDIESIEVLKDAGSAAIYGARAAYGVVLVTTKTGKKNSLSANYNGYYGVQNAARKLRLLNATEYATLINESLGAAGQPILYPDPQALGQGTDWQDAVFTEDAPIQDHQFSVSGGGEKSTVFLSLGLFDQQGIVGGDDSQYRRYNIRMNSRHELNDRITVGNTIGYTRIKASGVATNSEFGSPLGRAVNIDPITPIYETDPDVLAAPPYSNQPVVSDNNGIFGISDRVTSEIVNPLAALEVQQGFGWSDKVVGSVYAEVELLKGLRYRTNFGADIANFGGEGFTPIYYLNASTITTQTSYGRNSGRGLLWNWDNTLTYKKTIKDHSFTVLAGITALKNQGNGQGGAIANLPVDNIEDASLAFFADIQDQTFSGFEYENQLASYFGRFYYNFQEKYLFSAIVRRDGSSNFVPTNQFAIFPSFSAGWVVTEENFIGNNPYVNYLKIRGSWGINGNDNINGAAIFSTVAGGRTYTFGTGDVLVDGASLNGIANPNLKWEENQQFNIGFDAKLFKKFSLSADYFIKKTRDMILPVIAPDFTGTGDFTANVGTMENEGVDLELGYGNNFGKLKVDVSANVSYIQNEVTFLAPGLDFLVGQTYSPQGLEVTRTVAGNPIGFIFGLKTDGLFQTQEEVDNYVNADGELLQPNAGPGDIRFVDFNQDGIVDNDDRTMIGDPTPSWTYGLTVDLTYGGFNLLVVGQGVQGNEVYNATRRPDLPTSNYTADALGRWTGEGTSNFYPRLINGDPNKNFSTSSDFFVEDASFFRIRTLQLGYTLPAALVDQVGLNKVRVYVSGNNLLTFTNYKGFDPEVVNGVDRGLYPQPRFYLVGLSVGF
jgi:TonB-linked SusC/RagA family outer membrane protein